MIFDENLQHYLSQSGLWVMRTVRGDIPLNVSYSPAGLAFTLNRDGTLAMFKNAKLDRYEDMIYPVAKSKDGLDRSDKVYIEKYVPKNHYNKYGNIDMRKQGVEFGVARKASKLLIDMNNHLDPVHEVYSTKQGHS